MKIKSLLFASTLFCVGISWSQSTPNGYHKLDVQLKHWLAQPQVLASEQPEFFKKGPLSNPMIPILFKTTSGNAKELISKVGGEVHTQLGNIYTAVVPLNAVIEFASNQAIVRVESPVHIKRTNDKAKQLTGANLVLGGQLPGGVPYSGKGIIVGVFDSGIDFSHPDFRKKDNTSQTRILSIWDQTQNGGTTPTNYNYGSVWNNAQINAALSNPNSLNTHDDDGHGTHVAGSAAGLRGMAPDADIVVVKGMIHWDSDSTLVQDTKSLLDGVTYMKEQADAAGKPCVVNLSIGYYLGSPHDGSSLVEEGFDYLVTNNPGFFIVVAVGNENGKKQHWGGFELSQDSVWTYMKTGMLYGIFDRNHSDSIFISFGVDSAVANSTNWENLTDQKPIYQSSWYSLTDIKNALNGISLPATYSNGDTAMFIQLFATDYDSTRTEIRAFTTHVRTVYNDSLWDFGMTRMIVKGYGMVHAWWENYQLPYVDDPFWYSNVRVDDRLRYSDDNSTTNILACGNKTIAVGAFVNQTNFVNMSGQTTWGQNFNGDSSGTFANFSNLGPTTDGRIKPDISAPGINVASSRSRDASFPQFFLIDNQTVVLSGTSMAAPITTGAIALYLEKNPTTTFDQLKTALTNNALVDDMVTMFGAAPNNHFGSGRLDIYKAMGGAFHTGIQPLTDSKQIEVYPNPSNSFIEFNTPNQGLAEVSIYDLSGRLVVQLDQKDLSHKPRVDVKDWEKGLYFFTLKVNQQQHFGKFVVE